MRVADAMTTPVITVKGDDLLADVILLMIGNKISGVPVVDDEGAVTGLMSEGDLLRRIELGTACKRGFWAKLFASDTEADAYRRMNGRRVRDVMTAKAVTIEATDTLADAARLMDSFKVKRLPVTKDGRLTGMLTRADFMKVLGRYLAPAYEDTIVSDEEIVKKIRDEIEHQGWASTCYVRVACNDGHVVLTGTSPDEAKRRALIVAAEIVEGVRSVEDRTDICEPVPMIGM